MSNLRKKITFTKPDNIIILGFFIYLISRIIFLMLSVSLRLQPFLSYDDVFFYDPISVEQLNPLKYYLIHKEIFYVIAAICNKLRINELLTGTRLFNFTIYFLCCICIRRICIRLNYNKNISNKIFICFLVLPYYLFYSVSTYKDILCMYSVLALFDMYLSHRNKEKISLLNLIILSSALYFVRFGIFESFIALILGIELIEKKNYKKFGILIFIITIGVVIFMNSNYSYVFMDKYNAYVLGGHSSKGSAGLLGKFEVTSIKNVYNIIPLVIYGQITPLPGTYMSEYLQSNSWGAMIGYFGFISAFLIPYFWDYIFCVNKNKHEKIIITFYILWIISIMITNPGTNRFLFFITPIFYFISINNLIRNFKKIYLLTSGLVCFTIPFIYLYI
ncbi:hypothetical protein FDB40_12860 [Clostridium botulinum]|nr:hypothetical protein [Clostridium botulinum]